MAIAGGTDLIPYLKGMFSPVVPETIVNLKTIPNMDYIKEEGGMLKVGALAKLAAIANNNTIKTSYTALAQAAKAVAAPELRNMGTIGGNICQTVRCAYYRNEYNDFPCHRKVAASPCYALTGYNRKYHSIFGAVEGCVAVCPSDTAIALVAMNAKIITSTPRTINAADFFTTKVNPNGEGITTLNAGEIVTEIQVPTPAAGVKSTYVKFAFRKAIDFAVVSVAAMATVSGGNASNASIVMGGVYNTPRRATTAETAINGKAIDATNAAAAGDAAATGTVPLGQNQYKVQIIKTMVKRALLAIK
jgi:xanthine dehydrogenase YagS FAD-binding subunit